MNEEKNNLNQDKVIDATSIFNQPINRNINNNSGSVENADIVSPKETPMSTQNNPGVMTPNMNTERPNVNQTPNMNTERPNVNQTPNMSAQNNPGVMTPNMNTERPNVNQTPNMSTPNNPSVMTPNMNTERPNVNQTPNMSAQNNPGVMTPNMNTERPNVNQTPNMSTQNNPGVMIPNMNTKTPNMSQTPNMSTPNNPGVMTQNMSTQNNPGVMTQNMSTQNNPGVMIPNMNTERPNMNQTPNMSAQNNPGVMTPNMNTETPNMNQTPNMSTQMMNMQPILEPIMPQVNNEPPKEKKEKTKKKKFPIVIIIILLILIAIIGGGIFYLKSINVYEKMIEKTFKKYEEAFNYNKATNTLTFSTNIIVDEYDSQMQPMLDMINNIDVSLKIQQDIKNNLVNNDFNIIYKGNDLINVNIYQNNNEAYVFLKNIYDKYIQIPIEEQTSLTLEEQRVLINSIYKALKESISDDYITRTFNKNNWKNTLTLDNKTVNNIINDMCTSLSNNDEFIKVIAKIDEETAEILKTFKFENYEFMAESEKILINTYTSLVDNEFLDAELIYELEEKQEEIITLNKEKNVYTISYKGSETEETITITVNENENNKEMIIGLNSGGIKIEINIKSSVDYNEEIKPQNITNSISVEQLTEADLEIIKNNLMQNPGINEIININSSFIYYLLSSMETKVESEYNDSMYDDIMYGNTIYNEI